ncbi:MAG: adenylyltransferase/cytidyltransferase family protein [Gammaproteobacteria bacterium]|nr:adenylyltransferase/cytidyltransferase family protein [Gammaproteobacteria bacterium]
MPSIAQNSPPGISTAVAFVAVTGRFQPFHVDHLELLKHALTLAEQVLICITNADARCLQPAAESAHRHMVAANPFTWFERLRIIEAALEHQGVARARYVITPFPLNAPGSWPAYVPAGTPHLVRIFSDWEREKCRRLRAGDYPVIELQGDPEHRVSASDIRAAMGCGDPAWREHVPEGALSVLEGFGEEELRLRCAPSANRSQPG